jgi:dGTPase
MVSGVDSATPNPGARLRYETVPLGDDRTDFRRDRDIILYTSAFKRLSGITQVTSAETGHVFHNRLTHSLQVAQVGKSLAEKLHIHKSEYAKAIGLDPDAVEAGCLAHDLGHPPFGHIAESALNRLVGDEAEGFEGNAQSFRIVTELAFRSGLKGLNLTRATLQALLKYPWTYKKRPPDKQDKWGAYESEIESFAFATDDNGGGPVPRTAASEIMDWSDDLTYAVHDVEDFFRAGLIPLHLMRPSEEGRSDPERDRFLEYVWERRQRISDLKDVAQQELDDMLADLMIAYFKINRPYDGTREQRARLRSFTSGLVNRYINGLTLELADGAVKVSVDRGQRKEIAILKQLTWRYVIEAPGLAVQQHAQKQVVRYLWGVFRHEVRRTPSTLLPPYFKERLKEVISKEGELGSGSRRIVCDLIAGMTETQAIALYQRLNGIVPGSPLDRILV